MKKNQVLLIAVAGAAVGGAIALLTAPRLGLEMRRKLIDAAFQQLDRLVQKAEHRLDSAYENAIRRENAIVNPNTPSANPISHSSIIQTQTQNEY